MSLRTLPSRKCHHPRARFQLECLEARSLLTATGPDFIAPDVSDLFLAARNGENTSAAAFTRTLTALQDQLTSGPLADLAAERVGGDAFVAEVTSLVSSFQASVDQAYLRFAPRLARLLDLQGTAILTTERLFNTELQANLFPKPTFSPNPEYYYLKASTEAVRKLTLSRPLWPLGTPVLAYFNQAGLLAAGIQNDVVANLGPGAPHPLTLAQAQAVATGEAETLRTNFDASLTRHPRFAAVVDAALTQFETSMAQIQPDAPNPQAQASAALDVFESQVLDGNGLFGPRGPLEPAFQRPQNDLINIQFSKAITFTGDRSRAIVLKNQEVFFRVFSDAKGAPVEENNFFGSFSSTLQTFRSQTAIRVLALDQSFFHPNLATMKVDVVAPAGTTVYVGAVAPIPQGVLFPEADPSLYPGGAQQTVILTRNTSFVNPRPIQTPA
jgi:hypothetical protein